MVEEYNKRGHNRSHIVVMVVPFSLKRDRQTDYQSRRRDPKQALALALALANCKLRLFQPQTKPLLLLLPNVLALVKLCSLPRLIMKLQIEVVVIVLVVVVVVALAVASQIVCSHRPRQRLGVHHRATLMITCYRVVILHKTLMTTLLQCCSASLTGSLPCRPSIHPTCHAAIDLSIDSTLRVIWFRSWQRTLTRLIMER